MVLKKLHREWSLRSRVWFHLFLAFLLFYWSYSQILCSSTEPSIWILLKTFLIWVLININLQVPLLKILICEEVLLNIKMIVNIRLVPLIIGLRIFIYIFKSFCSFQSSFTCFRLQIKILNRCEFRICELILACSENNLVLFFIFGLWITEAVAFS